MIPILSILILFTVAALQVRLPAVLGFRLELLPALVAYAALTFPRAGALGFAVLAGFLHDALTAGPFGVTAMVYGPAAWFIHRLGGALDREIPPLQIVTGMFVALVGGIAGCLFAGFNLGHLYKLLMVTGASAVITPVTFFVLDFGRYQLRTLR
jgi:cell shape-determining protein MreD